MYVANPQWSDKVLVTELIANHIYGPSYVSMESAMRFYGLIPEIVFTTISLTTGTARSYCNEVGTFRYIHCSTSPSVSPTRNTKVRRFLSPRPRKRCAIR